MDIYSHAGLWKSLANESYDAARSQNGGNPPPGDDTVIDFWQDSGTGNFYETQRQAYQGSQSSGSLLLTTITCWNGNNTNCTTTAVSPPITRRTVTTKYPSNGLASEVDSVYTTTGLLTETDQYAYGTGGTPGALARKTTVSYASLVNILDHPQTISVTDAGGNLLSKTTYNYDEYSSYPLQATSGTPQHVSVSSSRGNPTTISSTVIGSTTLSKHFEYFDTGMVYQAIDVNGATTTYNYPDANTTCGNTFPTSVTPPISGLTSSTAWNCAGGVSTSITDANGKVTNTTFTDPYFWRPASVQDPVGATTNFTYNPRGANLANVDSKMLFNNGASVVEQLTTVNQFGPTCVFATARRAQFFQLGFDTGALRLVPANRSGNTITAPVVAAGTPAPNGGYTIQDPNGNQLTYNGSTNAFTDTMGGSAVLTVGNSSSVTYTYNAPAGTAQYSVSYFYYPLWTAFGCSGVAEYSTQGKTVTVALVTGINLPDGTSYLFSYEDSPGHSGYKTGRLDASLP